MKLPSNYNPADILLAGFSWLSGLLVLLCFGYLFADIFSNGYAHLDWQFITTAPENAGRDGGIAPMIISTTILLFFALLFSLPIGIFSAIYLAEYTSYEHRFARLLRYALNTLAAVPSIVMGMFGFAFFVIILQIGFSLLAGALTLAIMILPLLIRNIEDSLRNIPHTYRLNAAALGLSQVRTIFQILLPMAKHGIAMAVVLSVGRAMAETAALLFTAGYVMRMPDSLMDSGRSLSVHIFDLSMNVPGGEKAAYATTIVLLFSILIINAATVLLSNQITRRSPM